MHYYLIGLLYVQQVLHSVLSQTKAYNKYRMQLVRNSNYQPLCTTMTPNLTKYVRSQMECSIFCSGIGIDNCIDFSFNRETKSCSIYSNDQISYNVVSQCYAYKVHFIYYVYIKNKIINYFVGLIIFY